jgi:SAM-dependent methyltransferase
MPRVAAPRRFAKRWLRDCSSGPARAISPPSPVLPVPTLNEDNKSAWDHLYASTPDLIWGREPVGFLRACLPRAAELPPGEVLDAGAGEGRNLPLLLSLGRPVSACDASVAALAKVPAASARRVTPIACELSCIPRPDATFAFVLLSDTLETLPEPLPVLQELRRVLAPGGLLLANIPDCDDEVFGVDMEPAGDTGWLYRHRYYYRFYSRPAAEALLGEAGFEAVSGRECAWTEPAHPHFRAEPHCHRSRIFLARRPR